MRSAITVSALLLALGAGVGLVVSQQRAPFGETAQFGETVGIGTADTLSYAPPYAAIVDDFDMSDATGSIAPVTDATRLSLNDEQRGFVFIGVINLPDIPDADIKAPRLAGAVPAGLALHDIPAMVLRKIPKLRDYRFVKLDDRILLVDAGSRRVADAIPRYKLVVNP